MSDENIDTAGAPPKQPAFLQNAEFIELNGKRPVDRKWTTDRSVRFDADEAAQRLAENRNVGVVLGDLDLVVDVDPRNGGDDSWERLQRDFAINASDFSTVRTGSGGQHIYMRLPNGAGRLKGNLERDGYPGIDLKFVGGQVVAPGSIHPETRKPYSVLCDIDPLDSQPLVPQSLLDLAARPAGVPNIAAAGSWSPERLAYVLSHLDVEDFREHARWLELMMSCHDATEGGGCDEFVEWSIGDPAYAGHGQIIGRRWDSLDTAKSGRITERTLIKFLVDANVAHLVAPDQAAALEDFDDIDPLEEPVLPGAITTANAKVQAKLHHQSKLPKTEAELNAMGYIATDADGGFRVFRRIWDFELNRDFWQVQKKQDFIDSVAGHSVPGLTPQGKETTVPVGSSWLRWPRRNRATKVVFDPARRIPASALTLNLWTGWSVQPRKGDWSLMQELLLEGLCDGNRELFEYVLDWSAFMIQNPDKPAEVAVFFVGGKGTGKGSYCRALTTLAGRHGMHVSDAQHLSGHFNAHLRDCVFLFVDEAIWAGDKKTEGTLKRVITEPTITVEGKGKDVVVAKNYLHVMGASNSPWVWPASEDERRLVISRVSNRFQGKKAFFDKLYRQMDDEGGLEAMLHDLQARDISKFHPRRYLPKTEELDRQIAFTRPRVVQELADLHANGQLPFTTGRELIGMYDDILDLPVVRRSIDQIGKAPVTDQIERWLRDDLGATSHERTTTQKKKPYLGIYKRPTEKLWSLADHDRYAAMSPAARADAFLEQKHPEG
ncbi:bifunctional DNA primase/polymerase [Sphingopyxis sp. RIFCSPHIGHO2_12_FULL_65_19]|uniref:bifunctional DNA primase/polymerase n=1 Tax=Sphingopyxis sp. RIFCSPHIGHO2_12_FULL_65_19 TaxID=1802172 RepID=UPI0008B2DECC|nr:bifunctional DNA primase/polymerase [Sphingopyxis sp. RIFCSPHIGHO2_12_FULL_65_19]OHD07571.1 MAG: hypothetical protein A3E77_09320 [Sphingopyxis sp. RIFCSPHIGHO2_12_FULL_65_19]